MLILCLSFAVAVIDQVTKAVVVHAMPLHLAFPVIPGFFDLRYIQNTGAAWGMMRGLNHWLVLLSVVMLGVLVRFRKHFIADVCLQRIAMGLMIGGIVGNLIDRIRLGYVVDFLDFYWRSHPYHFPAFNIADASICVGVGLYILSQVLLSRQEAAEAEAHAGA